jgi:hypothetical protein
MGNVDNVVGLVWILGYGVMSLPLKYLGLSLGTSYKAKHIWNSIFEKIERWLASWKKGCICIRVVGITLIKSTISNLPMYFMSPLSSPFECCKSY